MHPVRSLARPMLASMFVYGGLEALRNSAPKVPVADDVAQPVADAIPFDLPRDTEQLIKLNAAVQLGAGLLLGLGRLPRLSAAALAATLVPTTVAGHPFWEAEDEATRAQQFIHFLKNVSMLGGLMIAALDTEGRPSVGWRTGRAARRARRRAGEVTASAQNTVSHGASRTADAVSSVVPVGR